VAKKKVPHVDETAPEKPNALKFERFIFDVLPHAERWTVLATSRHEEFAPVKNRDDDRVDCPATARQMMNNLAAQWLRQAGIEVPADTHGNTPFNLEISPLFALDAEELRMKVRGTRSIDEDRYFGTDV
jgi:UDP-N-acetylglucosamine/UDP-N-acetylgalactosamine diphosphorylase